MKPVYTHTMGHGHKTVNVAPISADMRELRGHLLSKNTFFLDPPCALSLLCTPKSLDEMQGFLSNAFFGIKAEMKRGRPKTEI